MRLIKTDETDESRNRTWENEADILSKDKTHRKSFGALNCEIKQCGEAVKNAIF